ncbi:hypothetical protein [Paenibacillus hamazuiensis]|uniref:hypothetical protein n=1 Tax=Paenibacillus hamazuiensis TaxID=2936508 RepID=UPI00200C22E0|nr:hypothetical protein [Paenibacillus hamazuiensis]
MKRFLVFVKTRMYFRRKASVKNFCFNEQGAVSLYLILIVVPIFLFCSVFIDFARIKAAENQAENAVKTGLRSTLSAYSPALQPYGLFALEADPDQSKQLFGKVVRGNLSERADPNTFRYIDTAMTPGSEQLLAMYTLANHQVMKQQILEEMKYRAPVQFGLEITDKFTSTGVTSQMKSAARFAAQAEKAEKLLEKRDKALDEAWDAFVKIRTKAGTDYPFYDTGLSQLNELSGRVGIHTVDEVTQMINDGKARLQKWNDRLRSINHSIRSLADAGEGAIEEIRELRKEKADLQADIDDLQQKIADWEQLLKDVLEYAKLLAALKLKSANDYEQLSGLLAQFNEELAKAKKANEELNAELRKGREEGASGNLAADEVFAHIYGMGAQDFDDYASKAAAVVALFGGLKSQLQSVVFFTADDYAGTSEANRQYLAKVNELYAEQNPKESARNRNKTQASAGQKEQRSKAQKYLDQALKAMGGCGVISGDPFSSMYARLQGGDDGFFQRYMLINGQQAAVPLMEETDLDNADKAGKTAMKLIDGLADLLTAARDDMYMNEFALGKFSYRTYGIEKDSSGNVKNTLVLSAPETHPLSNQEVEYIIYGSNSCAGNYGKAYAELFAIRLAIGTIESLMEPQNELLNVGSPLLVFLAAVAEGAVKAQADMIRLLDGEAVPLSAKIGKGFTLYYKDYLRLFLLLHGRDKVMLSRMQALLQLNTGFDLRAKATYVQGSATMSVKLWFMPGLMRAIGPLGVHGCIPAGNRCEFVKTAYLAY